MMRNHHNALPRSTASTQPRKLFQGQTDAVLPLQAASHIFLGYCETASLVVAVRQLQDILVKLHGRFCWIPQRTRRCLTNHQPTIIIDIFNQYEPPYKLDERLLQGIECLRWRWSSQVTTPAMPCRPLCSPHASLNLEQSALFLAGCRCGHMQLPFLTSGIKTTIMQSPWGLHFAAGFLQLIHEEIHPHKVLSEPQRQAKQIYSTQSASQATKASNANKAHKVLSEPQRQGTQGQAMKYIRLKIPYAFPSWNLAALIK